MSQDIKMIVTAVDNTNKDVTDDSKHHYIFALKYDNTIWWYASDSSWRRIIDIPIDIYGVIVRMISIDTSGLSINLCALLSNDIIMKFTFVPNGSGYWETVVPIPES